jgi:hypothetical protein
MLVRYPYRRSILCSNILCVGTVNVCCGYGLSCRYLFRRLFMNPGFYGVIAASARNCGSSKRHVQPTATDISTYCSSLVQVCIKRLVASGCITVNVENASRDLVIAENNTRIATDPSSSSNREKGKRSEKSAKPDIVEPAIHILPTALGHVSMYVRFAEGLLLNMAITFFHHGPRSLTEF